MATILTAKFDSDEEDEEYIPKKRKTGNKLSLKNIRKGSQERS
jgi:hypothetical protein